MVWMHEAQSPKNTMHERDKNNVLSDNYLGQKQWACSSSIEYMWLSIMLAQKKKLTAIRMHCAKHVSGPVPQICYILCPKTGRTRILQLTTISKEKLCSLKFQSQFIRPVIQRFQDFKDYIESYVRRSVTLILQHLYLWREKNMAYLAINYTENFLNNWSAQTKLS